MQCSKCQTDNLADALFCEQCGEAFDPHGRFLSWQENGMKEEEGNFDGGERVGTWARWNDYGTREEFPKNYL